MALDWSSTRGPSGDLSSPPGGPRSHVRRPGGCAARTARPPGGSRPSASGPRAVAYLWNLTASGYANTYYSAAAQAASQSWSAMFFGSIDAAGFITVDKPPVSLWAMGLSVRVLGLSPFAILLPEALAGIGAVLLLWDAVRRQLGREAALLPGIAFALTPAAVLMFRYNNPDAVLVLLLVGAAWALVRGPRDRRPAVGRARRRPRRVRVPHQVPPGVPGPARVRADLARGGAGHRCGAGSRCSPRRPWRSSRRPPGGSWSSTCCRPRTARTSAASTNNTALDLLLGYDGLGRIFGREAGVAGGGGPRPGGRRLGWFGGAPGLLRLFNGAVGRADRLAPAGGGDRPRCRARRALAGAADGPAPGRFLLWGAWALVHVLVFSLMGGIVHPYYAVALAPALAALAGGGVVELWRARVAARGRVGGARPRWSSSTAVVALAAARADAGVLARARARRPVRRRAPRRSSWWGRRSSPTSVRPGWRAPRSSSGCSRCSPGPALYSARDDGPGDLGRRPVSGPRRRHGFGGASAPLRRVRRADPGGTTSAGSSSTSSSRTGATRRGWSPSAAANQAGPIQLASGVPVMAMGGFMGSDPAPTLSQLQADVRDGSLRYVLLGGPGGVGGPAGARAASSAATAGAAWRWSGRPWVADACTPLDGRVRRPVRLRGGRGRGLSPADRAGAAISRAFSAPPRTSHHDARHRRPAPSRPAATRTGASRARRRRPDRRQRRPDRRDVGPPRRPRPARHGRRDPAPAIGQLSALLGTYLALVGVVLMARSPGSTRPSARTGWPGTPLDRLRDDLADRRRTACSRSTGWAMGDGTRVVSEAVDLAHGLPVRPVVGRGVRAVPARRRHVDAGVAPPALVRDLVLAPPLHLPRDRARVRCTSCSSAPTSSHDPIADGLLGRALRGHGVLVLAFRFGQPLPPTRATASGSAAWCARRRTWSPLRHGPRPRPAPRALRPVLRRSLPDPRGLVAGPPVLDLRRAERRLAPVHRQGPRRRLRPAARRASRGRASLLEGPYGSSPGAVAHAAARDAHRGRDRDLAAAGAAGVAPRRARAT